MNHKIKIEDIYDKNINFLIGSGASSGLFPTLALELKDEFGTDQTIETLATYFEDKKEKDLETLLFLYYYQECILPALSMDVAVIKRDPQKREVIENYKLFLETIITILQNRNNIKKSCNIFTTNYDNCFSVMADEIIQSNKDDFIVNDGASGFKKRYLQAKNFNNTTLRTGVFERHSIEIPQINLIHLHGSVSWRKENDDVIVDHHTFLKKLTSLSSFDAELSIFSKEIKDKSKTSNQLTKANFTPSQRDVFWDYYNQLPIVNPTKWKFHETVFNEHYYQMLRFLSYELEKPNSIFIVFGFSFADEHIRNLIKRSMSNPSLKIFVCCYSEDQRNKIDGYFKGHRNITYIIEPNGGNLNFNFFNKHIFTLNTHESTDQLQNCGEEE